MNQYYCVFVWTENLVQHLLHCPSLYTYNDLHMEMSGYCALLPEFYVYIVNFIYNINIFIYFREIYRYINFRQTAISKHI